MIQPSELAAPALHANSNSHTLLRKRNHRIQSTTALSRKTAKSSYNSSRSKESSRKSGSSPTDASSKHSPHSQRFGGFPNPKNMMRPSRLTRNRHSHPTEQFDVKPIKGKCFKAVDSDTSSQYNSLNPGLTLSRGKDSKEALPPRTFDQSREDEIIELLEEYQRVRLQEDPLSELDEALMDRSTASLNRRQKITSIEGNKVIIKEVSEILAGSKNPEN
jgi:hypothetical protein